MRFLKATRVSSGDRAGHSIPSATTRMARRARLPSTRYVEPPVPRVAKKRSPSAAKVTPQKLKSSEWNGRPSRTTGSSSMLATTSAPVSVSTMLVSVEKRLSAYEWPETKTVIAACRPSGETRVRLGIPLSGMRCRGRKAASKSRAV